MCRDHLVLVFGMACPLRCDFCCHPVEQYGAWPMRHEDAVRWIREANAIPGIGLVVFTGGEPFAAYRRLLRVLEDTADTHLPVRIVTAAHWATSDERARTLLAPLAALGVRELSVSTDPSHQAFVPAEQAECAARIGLELGLRVELAGVFWDGTTRVEDVVRVPEGCGTARHAALPIGRAAGRQVSAAQYGLDDRRFGGCQPADEHDITIYPDGETYPCCSGGYNIQARLSAGNARTTPLAELVDRIHQDRYLRVIMRGGFGLVRDLARWHDPGALAALPDFAPLVSPCQVCAAVHSRPEALAALEPVLALADRVLAAAAETAAAATAAPCPRA
jgi:MoaA/NifB/PqqE/SkfB family radical SAM enzyme